MSDFLRPAARYAQDLLELARDGGSSDPRSEVLAQLDDLERRDAGLVHPSGVTAEEYYAEARRSLGQQAQTEKWPEPK